MSEEESVADEMEENEAEHVVRVFVTRQRLKKAISRSYQDQKTFVMWLEPYTHFRWGHTNAMLGVAGRVHRKLVDLGYDVKIDTEQPANMTARPKVETKKIDVPPRYEIVATMDVPGTPLDESTNERLMQIRILRHVPALGSSSPILVEQTDGVDAIGNVRWRVVRDNYHLIHALAVEYVRLKGER